MLLKYAEKLPLVPLLLSFHTQMGIHEFNAHMHGTYAQVQ